MTIQYKTEQSEQKCINEAIKKDPISCADHILDKLLISFEQDSINSIFSSISELNRYLKKGEIDINEFNYRHINDILYALLFENKNSPLYDNIIRVLKSLISIPGFDLTPFENDQFFQQVLLVVTPCLKYPSNGILLLASILDASEKQRSILLNSDIISYILEISFTNESIKSASFSFFASSLKILDDFLACYLDIITHFFYQVLVEKVKIPNLLCNYFETLLERVPSKYVSNFLVNQIDFTPFFEKFQSNDKYDQIASFKLILLLLKIKNKAIYEQIDFKYFAFIFEKPYELESDFNDAELNDKMLTLFFKISKKILFYKPFVTNYIDSLLCFSISVINLANFEIKKVSLSFLTKLITVMPSVLPKLIELDYIGLLSQYLECTGYNFINAIIKSILYILHTATPKNEERIFSIMEQEEIWIKINAIFDDIDERDIRLDSGETQTSNMIQEFNVLYDQLAKKIQINPCD